VSHMPQEHFEWVVLFAVVGAFTGGRSRPHKFLGYV
jgi:hypothetical protein